MNFVDFRVFDQYIKNNFQNLSTYIVLLSDYFEKKLIAEHIRSLYPGYELFTFEAGEENLQALMQEIRTPSLFASKKIFFIEEASQFKKGAFSLKTVPRDTILVFTSSAKKLYLDNDLLEKAATLDLSKEKPWEKEKRLFDFLATMIQKQKKSMSAALYPLLLEKTGPDLATLEQQIEKLVCYIGNRPSIEKEDIEEVVEASASQTAWKMGEEIVWKLSWEPTPESMDSSFFYALLSSIRFQLQLGLGISILLEKGEKDIASHFPRIYPSTLKKRITEVKSFSKSYFEKALLELFRMELISKSSAHSLAAILDQFTCKLSYF